MTEKTSTLLSETSIFADAELHVGNIKYLINKDNPTILEIGANCGQTTIEFLNILPNAKIYCFEPDPHAISKFEKNGIKIDDAELMYNDKTNSYVYIVHNKLNEKPNSEFIVIGTPVCNATFLESEKPKFFSENFCFNDKCFNLSYSFIIF